MSDAWAVNCSETDITLSNQTAVNTFQTMYGNGGTCDTVTGDLRIEGISVINLDGLSALVNVGQNIYLYDNSALTDIDGLSALTNVGGDLWIESNWVLTNFDGLSALTSVGRNLRIKLNSKLTDIDGLSALTSVGGELHIEHNESLANLHGLSALTTVGDTLRISNNNILANVTGFSALSSIGYLFVSYNPALTQIDGFSSLTSSTDGILISHNDSLIQINGLSGLTSLRNVLIADNDSLTQIDGLSGIGSVDGHVSISGNDLLGNVDGLSGISSVAAHVAISDNDSLTQITGLAALTSVGSYLTVENNNVLTGLDGLSALTNLGTHLVIRNNDALVSLDGFPTLTSINGNLEIDDNKVLQNLDALSTITSVGQSLGVLQNDLLVNIDGLSSVAQVGEDLTIWGHDSLVNMDGLSALSVVGRYMSVEFNSALSSIDGLSRLTSIGGGLSISTNTSLSSINGLPNLTSVGGAIDISRNSQLISIDGFPSVRSIAGDLYISDNKSLTHIGGFKVLESVGGGLSVFGNRSLVTITGLALVSQVDGDLSISQNYKLVDLNSLSSLAAVGGGLYISYNDSLVSLDGFSALDSLGGNLSFLNNNAIPNLNGLSALASIGGSLTVEGNDNLIEINGLLSLTNVAGFLRVSENRILTNVDGLSSLNNVDGDIWITSNIALPNLDGLSALTGVNGVLSISGNTMLENLDGLVLLTQLHGLNIQRNRALTDITGLSSLTGVENDVLIKLNPLLDQCDGLAKLLDGVDDGVPGPGPGVEGIPDVGGNVGIQSNLNACNSVEWILSPPDEDNDGVTDWYDNCPSVVNVDQADSDSDGIGDACRDLYAVDSDHDGVWDVIDNCPALANSGQDDIDNDGVGDVCDDQLDTNQQSEIVAEISEPNWSSSGPCSGMIEVNSIILADVRTREHGCELHKIDDQRGVQLLADIWPGEWGYQDHTYRQQSDFDMARPMDGWHYFKANDGENGSELWRTDGTTVQPVGSGDEWLDHFTLVSQKVLKDRLYFTAETNSGGMRLYSTDGLSILEEPSLVPGTWSSAKVIGSFQDKLLLFGYETVHGSEPWVYDGETYHLLGELIEGPGDSLVSHNEFTAFNDHWLFKTNSLDSQGNKVMTYFKTDGSSLSEIPLLGIWPDSVEWWHASSVRNSDAVYQVMGNRRPPVLCCLPEPPVVGWILRINDTSRSIYELGEKEHEYSSSSAVLGEDALALWDNKLFRLGETSAEEIELTIPTNWLNSSYRFVASNQYFDHAYIMEIDEENNTRVWAWSYTEVGLLMADDFQVVTSADNFRHFGNDIYFYGFDELKNRALRKVPDAVIKPAPRMAAVTGSWFEPATSGQGFVLHPTDDQRTVFSFYGFENNGKHLWLTGVGTEPLEPGKTITVDMRIASGGNFGSFTPDEISDESWGTMDIVFDTCHRGTAELDGLSGQQIMDLVHLARVDGLECDQRTPPKAKTAGITGSWYDPATTGQGLILHSINDKQMVVSFYGYNNNSEQMWLIGPYNGQVAWGEPLEMPMTVATGGNFGEFDPQDITRTEWGTLTINFADCNNATATLSGTDGQQTMNMVKLAGLQGSGLECH